MYVSQIQQQITDCVWDSKRPANDPHEWVGKLRDTCDKVSLVDGQDDDGDGQ